MIKKKLMYRATRIRLIIKYLKDNAKPEDAIAYSDVDMDILSTWEFMRFDWPNGKVKAITRAKLDKMARVDILDLLWDEVTAMPGQMTAILGGEDWIPRPEVRRLTNIGAAYPDGTINPWAEARLKVRARYILRIKDQDEKGNKGEGD